MALRLSGGLAARLVARSANAAPMLSRRRYSEMPLVFSTPNEVFYNNDSVKQIDVPSFSGAFGILPNHVPTMAALKPGVVSVSEENGNTVKYFVSSGTVTVNADASVQLLAEEACLLSDIDANLARDALNAANSSLSSAKDEVEKAEASIAVEAAEAIVKGIS